MSSKSNSQKRSLEESKKEKECMNKNEKEEKKNEDEEENEPPIKRQKINEEDHNPHHHHHSHHQHNDNGNIELWRPNSIWNEMFHSPIDRYVKSIMQNTLGTLNNSLSLFEPTTSSSLMRSFRSDMVELDNEYQVHADLPGIKKHNINVNFKDGKLEIDAKRENKCDEWTENHQIHHQEVNYGSFYRSYHLPKSHDIKSSQIKANYENGVLTIHVPKPKLDEPQQNKDHSVHIE